MIAIEFFDVEIEPAFADGDRALARDPVGELGKMLGLDARRDTSDAGRRPRCRPVSARKDRAALRNPTARSPERSGASRRRRARAAAPRRGRRRIRPRRYGCGCRSVRSPRRLSQMRMAELNAGIAWKRRGPESRPALSHRWRDARCVAFPLKAQCALSADSHVADRHRLEIDPHRLVRPATRPRRSSRRTPDRTCG